MKEIPIKKIAGSNRTQKCPLFNTEWYSSVDVCISSCESYGGIAEVSKGNAKSKVIRCNFKPIKLGR
jgi:hypothetical protein